VLCWRVRPLSIEPSLELSDTGGTSIVAPPQVCDADWELSGPDEADARPHFTCKGWGYSGLSGTMFHRRLVDNPIFVRSKHRAAQPDSEVELLLDIDRGIFGVRVDSEECGCIGVDAPSCDSGLVFYATLYGDTAGTAVRVLE
jgi:hypothetical protein